MQARDERNRESAKELERRVPALACPDFVARHVRSLLKEGAPEAGCKVELIHSKGTGRMTLRYGFDDGVTVYGKVYTDGLGPASYSLLRQLWGNGFGPGSAERVPEAFVPARCQYAPANVFIAGRAVTVIDVDKLSRSDPAKDVALFLFRTSDLLGRAAGRAAEAERLGGEFLDAYREQGGRPIEN